jgi:hypothetical protein
VAEYEQAVLAGITQTGHRGCWWQLYGDMIGDQFRELLALESAAARFSRSTMRSRSPTYCRPRTTPGRWSPPTHALRRRHRPRAGARRQRKRQKTVPGKGTRLVGAVGDAALHQRVSGPDVMAAQLRWLAVLSSDAPVVSLQVLPFTAGAHPVSATASLTVLRSQALTCGETARLPQEMSKR